MTNYDSLHNLGQSLWYDNIQRSLLDNGELRAMIERGEIKGVTSNPSIFHNAIAKTKDYDKALKPLAWSGLSAEEIFWELAIKDIQDAADLFLDIFQKTNKKDGYVSLEVSPFLARDTKGTILEAQRLWKRVNKPNLMIKIPATKEGLPAIRECIALGINVNVTLIFSIARYKEVIDAFMSGLEDRQTQNKPLDSIASVASFFVSRVDSKVDAILSKSSDERAPKLAGKAAIGNAKLAYELFNSEFSSDRFKKLAQYGAQKQRPLWASTSTKNPDYRDVIYIEELIGLDTVNTVPPATLKAFGDHGQSDLTIGNDLGLYKNAISTLESLGILMSRVTQELEDEGVKAFADAFEALLKSVEDRRLEQAGGLSAYADTVRNHLTNMQKEGFVQGVFDHNPELWTKDVEGQKEIRIRMDWTSAPWDSMVLLPQLETLLSECRDAGFTHALLLGMGGSSLAPEVIRLINGLTEYKGSQGLDLSILDSTNPEEVLIARQNYPIRKTLYIVASKSGTTGEINAFFRYFWNEVSKVAGEETGRHFLAITDPGTKLDQMARERGFWKVINANPHVGGRNSALTAFGLVPAALVGMDVRTYLEKARNMADSFKPEQSVFSNQGLVLGTVIAEAAKNGQDKLTVITDSEWNSFGNWLEQLVAESSGKEGKGIVPVAAEPRIKAEQYSRDRLFVYIGKNANENHLCVELRQLNRPVIALDADSSYDLSEQFYLWEFATAVACAILGVNSFDQPDVQDAKTRTLAGIAEYKQKGKLNFGTPVLSLADGDIYSTINMDYTGCKTLRDVIFQFIEKNLRQTDYVSLNAFLPRTPTLEADLQLLRQQILEKQGNAVTLGFGPRFLHSTGQLHKGGPDTGLFIEFVSDHMVDADIPEEGLSFGTMATAQALGDYAALEAKNRRVLRIHLRKPSVNTI